MRFGIWLIFFQVGIEWSKFCGFYGGVEVIYECYRYCYEVNFDMVDEFESKGFYFVVWDDVGNCMEVFEFKDYLYFVGLQVYFEYRSKVIWLLLLFLGFVVFSVGFLDKVFKEIVEEKVVVNGYYFQVEVVDLV